jgi:replicative DNA helicase
MQRKLPHSEIAESYLLGSLLLGKTSVLPVDAFFENRHRYLYELIKQQDNADIVSLSIELEKQSKTDLIPYIAELSNIIPSDYQKDKAESEIDKCYKLRLIAEQASKLYAECTRGDDNTDLAIANAEKILFSAVRSSKEGFTKVSEIADRVFDDIEKVASGEKSAWGVPTGFAELDNILGGLIPKDLIIVGARPSMGKTAFAMNIAENIANSVGSVGVVSLEMSGEGLTTRLISSLSGVDSYRLRTGKVKDSDWPKLAKAKEHLANMNLFIDDTSALPSTEIRSRCRRLHAQYGLKAIIVDYLQLAGDKSRSREEEISTASREMKATAKELDLPVIAICQLNRTCESRPDKRPILSDLRDSGAIEQDADVIIFPYRDEYYHPETKDKGIAELLIRKQRNGPTGTVRLVWDGNTTRFKDEIKMHRQVY